MRKYITRLLPLGYLLTLAAMIDLKDYSMPMAVCAVVFLTFPTVLVFWKKECTLIDLFPWIAIAGLLLRLVLPLVPFDPVWILDAALKLFPLEKMLAPEYYDTLAALAVLVIVQYSFRNKKKTNPVILSSYVLLAFVLYGWARMVLPYEHVYTQLLTCLVPAYLIRELCTKDTRSEKPGLLICTGMFAFFLYIPCLVGYPTANEIAKYFLMNDDSWLRNLLMIFTMAILFWVDSHTRISPRHHNLLSERSQAEALMVWCLMYLLMRCWPELLNYSVLYIWFPVAYYTLMHVPNHRKIPTPVLWGIAVAILTALAKSLNMDLYCGPVLLLFVLIVSLFWNKQDGMSREVFALLLGIGSVFVLYSSQWGLIGPLELEPKGILVPVLTCVLFWVVTSHIKKLFSMASDSFLEEYAILRDLEIPAALVPFGLAILNILFILS